MRPFVDLVGPCTDDCHRPDESHGGGAEPGLNLGCQDCERCQSERSENAGLTVGLDPVVVDHFARIDVVLTKGPDEKWADNRRRRVSESVAGPVNDARHKIDSRYAKGKGDQHGKPPPLGHKPRDAQADPRSENDRQHDRTRQDRAAKLL